MLVGNLGLFDSRSRWEMFRKNKFEMMIFDKRVKFTLENLDEKVSQPPFASVYITSGILPKQIVFEEITRT